MQTRYRSGITLLVLFLLGAILGSAVPVSADDSVVRGEEYTKEKPEERLVSTNGTRYYLPWRYGVIWYTYRMHCPGRDCNQYNNPAWDFHAQYLNRPSDEHIVAVADGTVCYVQENIPDEAPFDRNNVNAGNVVVIAHEGTACGHEGAYSFYGHLKYRSVPVRAGQTVGSGQDIAEMGISGYSTGKHLHFSFNKNYRTHVVRDTRGRRYESAYGDTIRRTFSDPDRELREDGGYPRPGRWYESANRPRLGNNIARGKSVWYVTSVQHPTTPAHYAIDGNGRTRWASRFNAGFEYLILDLGRNYDVSQAVINWETAYARGYGVFYWNNGWRWLNWTNRGRGGIESLNFSRVGARWIGIGMWWKSSCCSNYSLWEFELYDNQTGAADVTVDLSSLDPEVVDVLQDLPSPSQLK